MALLRHAPARCRWTALGGALLWIAAGCNTIDVSQPVALVAPEWTDFEREILAAAAGCWNLRFGTQLAVGEADVAPLQRVVVRYSDMVCIYAGGRVDPNPPVRVWICPPAYKEPWGTARESLLMMVLTHELGHVLNIRSHGDDPRSVMAGKAYLPLYMRSTIFSDEDVALFRAANPEFDIPDGSCDPHLDEVPRPAVCRCR